MTASIIARKPKTIVLQIEVPVESDNMLDLENGLQRALNEAGRLGEEKGHPFLSSILYIL